MFWLPCRTLCLDVRTRDPCYQYLCRELQSFRWRLRCGMSGDCKLQECCDDMQWSPSGMFCLAKFATPGGSKDSIMPPIWDAFARAVNVEEPDFPPWDSRGEIVLEKPGPLGIFAIEGSHRSAKRMGEGVHFVEECGCQEVKKHVENPQRSGWFDIAQTIHGTGIFTYTFTIRINQM